MQLTDSHKVATPVDWKVINEAKAFNLPQFNLNSVLNPKNSIYSCILLSQVGDECMVLPTIKSEECAGLFPKGFKTIEVPSGKGYLRKTPYPASN